MAVRLLLAVAAFTLLLGLSLTPTPRDTEIARLSRELDIKIAERQSRLSDAVKRGIYGGYYPSAESPRAPAN